ncbi:MAG: hypothetical protein ACLGIW_13495, partial [Gammaproteobacteria bacterium]
MSVILRVTLSVPYSLQLSCQSLMIKKSLKINKLSVLLCWSGLRFARGAVEVHAKCNARFPGAGADGLSSMGTHCVGHD